MFKRRKARTVLLVFNFAMQAIWSYERIRLIYIQYTNWQESFNLIHDITYRASRNRGRAPVNWSSWEVSCWIQHRYNHRAQERQVRGGVRYWRAEAQTFLIHGRQPEVSISTLHPMRMCWRVWRWSHGREKRGLFSVVCCSVRPHIIPK